MENLDNIVTDLYGLVADVNAEEIADHIKRENLSDWSNSWRIAAKKDLNIVSQAIKEKRLFILPKPMTTDDIESIKAIGRILNNLDTMEQVEE